MGFSFEWTGHQFGDEADYQKGYDAAADYCGYHDIDPAKLWETAQGDDGAGCIALDQWGAVETAAFEEAFDGWQECPENVSLIWQ